MSFLFDEPSLKPTNFSNLKFWLDGDDWDSFSYTGNALTQWRDKSGLARHFTPNNFTIPDSSALRAVVNNRSAPILNGTNSYGSIPAGLFGINNVFDGLTMICVVKSNSANNTNQAIIGGQSGRTIILSMQKRTTGPGVRMRASSAGSGNIDTTIAVGTGIRVWVLRKDGNTLRGYIDNTVLGTTTAGQSVFNGGDMGRFAAFPTQLWNGHFCEFIFYEANMSIANINRLRIEYLAPKWGTSITPI